MKVKIMQRSVYHKYAEIEVEVPKDVDAQEWLINNESNWFNVMDDKISKAKYEFGLGLGNGMNEPESESEWRYNVINQNFGGHL
jgi:hypothetical protein|tara:strand:+ start:2635 stop:2886 length:252 start_codon:yes stop_codon:yes gene_type:complete